jgi:hypothetical protein
VAGLSVPFVPPEMISEWGEPVTFDDLVSEALNSIRTSDPKMFTALFIEGTSGSGKTRTGYELCQAVTEKLRADDSIASVCTLRLQGEDLHQLASVIKDPRAAHDAWDGMAMLLVRNAVGSKINLTDVKQIPSIRMVFEALLDGNSEKKTNNSKGTC